MVRPTLKATWKIALAYYFRDIRLDANFIRTNFVHGLHYVIIKLEVTAPMKQINALPIFKQFCSHSVDYNQTRSCTAAHLCTQRQLIHSGFKLVCLCKH